MKFIRDVLLGLVVVFLTLLALYHLIPAMVALVAVSMLCLVSLVLT